MPFSFTKFYNESKIPWVGRCKLNIGLIYDFLNNIRDLLAESSPFYDNSFAAV